MRKWNCIESRPSRNYVNALYNALVYIDAAVVYFFLFQSRKCKTEFSYAHHFAKNKNKN